MKRLNQTTLLVIASVIVTSCADQDSISTKQKAEENASHEALMRQAKEISEKDDSDYWDFSDPERETKSIDGSNDE